MRNRDTERYGSLPEIAQYRGRAGVTHRWSHLTICLPPCRDGPGSEGQWVLMMGKEVRRTGKVFRPEGTAPNGGPGMKWWRRGVQNSAPGEAPEGACRKHW